MLQQALAYLEQSVKASAQGSFALTELALTLCVNTLKKVPNDTNLEKFIGEITAILNSFLGNERRKYACIAESEQNILFTHTQHISIVSLYEKLKALSDCFTTASSDKENRDKIKVAVVCAIFMPTEAHKSIAGTSINTIKSNHFELEKIAVVNYAQATNNDHVFLEDNFDYIEVNDSNVLASAWNRGIKKGLERGADYVLVVNHDIALHPQGLDNLVHFAMANPNFLIWSASPLDKVESLLTVECNIKSYPEAHMSCYLVDSKIFDVIGGFDERFKPAYFEDSDILYRIRLAGGSYIRTELCWFYHLNRGCIDLMFNDLSDKEKYKLSLNMQNCEKLYIQKWGGDVGLETYSLPFNGRM